MTYKTYPGSLYDFTAGVLCGVLVTEPVMRKLAKLQAKHLEEVKRLLIDECERGNVFSSHWTLHYPQGKQTTVRFVDLDACVKDRIKNACHAATPKHEALVFVANGMNEAKVMADERWNELNETETANEENN